MKFSIAIPTYNRQKDLEKCLDSIFEQTILPNEIIVIDDGDLPVESIENYITKFLLKDCRFVFYKKNKKIERKGLSESKNKALDIVTNDKLFFLDDDVVLDRNFCKEIMQVWEKNRDDQFLVCVGGIIENRRKKIKIEEYFNVFFGISSKYHWDVNKVGFQVWDEEIKETSLGYYSHGGVCSLDVKKAKNLKFTTFSGGRTGLEDVDFCLRAKNKGYHILIEPKARLFHYPSVLTREKEYFTGFKESSNRKIIFKYNNHKKNIFLYIWFIWANIGWISRQFLALNFTKGIGMINGFLFG